VTLSRPLVRSALRLSGARPEEWLCPVCGGVVADDELHPEVDRPVHEHYGHDVALIERAQMGGDQS
jgi:hypothetical protein